MKGEERRLDEASRLGSAKKRKLTKAQRAERMAAANAALKRKLAKGRNVESGSESNDGDKESNDGDKENDLDRANTQLSGLQKNKEAFRKKAVYWKKHTEKLRSELRERKNHEMEKEEEEERQRTKRDYEEKLREEERLMLIEERDRALDELQREQQQRRVESDTYNEARGQLEERIQDYQCQIHALKAKVARIPARLVTATNCVARTYNAKADEERTFYLKNTQGVIPVYLKNTQGVIPDDARDVFLDLVASEDHGWAGWCRVPGRVTISGRVGSGI
ncbi:hypothetical protein F5878DRAFT_667572 [Lentinula raphanica]|uniref:Uncharacterized protein n=1 Tax=Lentinula raphanica TaxID=153919 RepID=A0AA38U4F4_9AGAR|nr:hypothetical protein F5878DRAFT_667572 [Lentinula raphanica]